jgi:hypothetical protein
VLSLANQINNRPGIVKGVNDTMRPKTTSSSDRNVAINPRPVRFYRQSGSDIKLKLLARKNNELLSDIIITVWHNQGLHFCV